MADEDIVGSASIRLNVDTSGVEGQILTGARAAAARAEQRLAQQQERANVRLGQLQARAQREDAQRTAAAVRNSERRAAALQRENRVLEEQARTAARTASIFAGVLAASFGLAFRRATELRAEFERSQVAFRGLLAESDAVKGGFETTAQAVQGLTADLQLLAIRSGADINDLSRGTQALITGLDLSRDAAVGLVEDIGAAAAASGAQLDALPRVIRAITQISSKGFLSAEELNQIADVLPVVSRTDIYENLAEALGKPIAEIQKLANEGGRITSAQGLPAVIKVLREVEGASDALDRQLQTLPGALNVLRQSARIAVQEGFDEASTAIRGFVTELGGIEGVGATFSEIFEPFDQISADVIRSLGESFIALQPVLTDLAEELAEFFGSVVGILPSLAQLAAISLQVVTAMLRLATAFEPVERALGALLAGFLAMRTIQVVVGLTNSLIVSLRGLSVASGTAAVGLRGVVAALGPMAFALTVAAGVMNLFGSSSKSAGESLANFNSALAQTGNLALSFSELGPDVEGLNGILVTFGRNSDEFRDAFNRLAPDIRSGFRDIVRAGQVATARNIIDSEEFAFIREELVQILEEEEEALKSAEKAKRADADAVRELIDPTAAATAAIAEFNEALKESTSQIQATLSADERLVDARERVADAAEKVRAAETDLAELRTELAELAAQNLVDLEEKRVELLEELAQAEEDVSQAERGLEDARRGLEDATDRVTDSEERLADAQRELNELFEPATERELAAARRDVQRAENSLADATERRVKAEEAIAAFERRKQNQGRRLGAIGLDNLRTNLANARAEAAALRQLPSEEALRDELADAILDEAEAKERVVDATEELAELERKGIPTAEELAEARREVERAERDVERARVDERRATEDLGRAEQDLTRAIDERNAARDIEAGLAPLRREQDEQERDLKSKIADQVIRIRDAQRGVTDARNAEALAIDAQAAALRILRGEQDAELRNLLSQVSTYERLGQIGPGSLQTILDKTRELVGQRLGIGLPVLTSIADALRIVEGVDGPYLALRRFTNPFAQFEEGGIITRPTMALMGEKNLKEVVLPLTKPARAIQLAQQSGFMDILSRNNQAFFPPAPISRPSVSAPLVRGTGIPGAAHDPLLAEIKTLNRLLSEGNLGETIDIDINAPMSENDRLKARKMARQIERAVRRGRRG